MMIFKEEIRDHDANDQYKTDFEYAVKLNRWLLQPLGLWPLNEENSKLEVLLSNISVIYSIIFLLFLTVPGCFEVLLIKDIETILRKIGPLSFNITNAIKFGFFLFYQRKIRFCLQKVNNDWCNLKNQNDRAIMIKSAQTARQFITICAIFMFGGGIPFCTIVPLLANSVSAENHTVRNLAFSGEFFLFDSQARPFYEVIFFLQFVCTLVTCSLTCGVCSLTILLVMHICGQLDIVMDLLKNLVPENHSKESQTDDKKMAYIVECHLRCLRFARQVENIMNEICLVEFLSSTFGICLIGYYLMTELERRNTTVVITYGMLFASYLFNIFMLCYISEKLLEQTEKIGKVTYMIEWNVLPAKTAINLILIIIVSSQPAKLTAGNMISFSLQCFCNVLKASVAYLNVIRTFVQ